MKGDCEAEQTTANNPFHNENTLASLAHESHKIFRNLAPPQSCPPGIELFSQGFLSHDVYCIESGLIKLVNLTQHGEELIVGLRSIGWVLGSVSLIAHEPNSVTAITLTKCFLRRISAEAFLVLLTTDPQFSWYIHKQHAQEIRDQVAHLVRLGSFSARQRLEHLFLQLISLLEPKGSQTGIRLLLPLRYYEIAQLVAITPQHLSRLLKQMQQEGIIRLEKGWVIVSDAKSLLVGLTEP